MQRFLYTKKRDIKMQWKYVFYSILSLVLALALSLKSLLTSLVFVVEKRAV